MRFERKYRVSGKTLSALQQMIKFHPAGFRVHHPVRQVNNIYFDTPALSALNQNVYGVRERKKFRLRWYGDDPATIHKARLEVKIKESELGRKDIFDFPDTHLSSLTAITADVNRLLYPQARLEPVLLSSYCRAYYISADRKFRLTIDYDMRYHSLRLSPSFHGYYVNDPQLVIEIKYNEADDKAVEFITQHIPFRQEKHSKYVSGVFMTNR
ncbi:MAG: polyphosphate polymerase domain-containing protein [Bacteroidia bacterium]